MPDAATRLASVGRPVGAALTPPKLQQKHQEYALSASEHRGGFAYDDIDEWAAITRIIIRYAWDAVDAAQRRGLMDAEFVATERKMLTSMRVCWRDKGLGALVQTEPAIRDNSEQADALRPQLRWLGRRYAEAIRSLDTNTLRRLMHSAAVPVNRGKGAPFWVSGADPQIAPAIVKIAQGVRDVDELEQRCAQVAGTGAKFWITVYIRIQQSAKPVPAWAWSPGGAAVIPDGERLGPKRRKVQALPFVLNYLQVPVEEVLRHVMTHDPRNRNTGTITYAERAVRHYKYSAALDLSNYDDTVSHQTIAAERDEIYLPALLALKKHALLSAHDIEVLLQVKRTIDTMPMLCPSPFVGEAHRLVPHWGGIVSGSRDTSRVGSNINDCRFEVKARSVGLTDYAFFNSSDDMVIATNDARGLERYGAIEKQHGFTETTSPETTYLMKRLTKTGPTGYGYLGRMLMSTINRETMNEHRTVDGFAAGVAVRNVLLTGHPCQPAYYGALEATGSPRLLAAVSAARAVGAHELSLRYLAQLSPTEDKERLSSFIRLLERAGFGADKALRASLERLTGRANATHAELHEMANDMTMQQARSIVGRAMFNRR